MSSTVPEAMLAKQMDRISSELSQRTAAIVEDYANTGFKQIPGSAVGQMAEAGLAAMQSLFNEAAAIAPSVPLDERSNFAASLDSKLNSLVQTAISRTPNGSAPELSAKRQHLVRTFQNMLTAANGGG